MDNQKSTAYIFISLAVIFWGISFVATKIALEQFPVFVLIFFRFSIALLIFGGFYALKKKVPRFSRTEHLSIFLMSFLEPVLYFYFETQGLTLTSAATASLLIATVPIFILIASFFILRERITIARIGGIILSVAGIMILITGAADFTGAFNDSVKGDLFIFGAVISATFYTILARKLSQRHSIVELTLMQLFYGTLFFAIPAIREMGSLDLHALSIRPVIALLYLTLFCTILGFLFYNKSLKHITASQNSVFINLIPVVTILSARFILNENLAPMQYMGAVIVIIGVLLANVTFTGFLSMDITRVKKT